MYFYLLFLKKTFIVCVCVVVVYEGMGRERINEF